ncbi:MAG: HEAT repeat domain-containing protein [Planctomycetales bacterium]|nr:HEAT repeat domain-containing protein [Planctomycetales bacterium]
MEAEPGLASPRVESCPPGARHGLPARLVAGTCVLLGITLGLVGWFLGPVALFLVAPRLTSGAGTAATLALVVAGGSGWLLREGCATWRALREEPRNAPRRLAWLAGACGLAAVPGLLWLAWLALFIAGDWKLPSIGWSVVPWIALIEVPVLAAALGLTTARWLRRVDATLGLPVASGRRAGGLRFLEGGLALAGLAGLAAAIAWPGGGSYSADPTLHRGKSLDAWVRTLGGAPRAAEEALREIGEPAGPALLRAADDDLGLRARVAEFYVGALRQLDDVFPWVEPLREMERILPGCVLTYARLAPPERAVPELSRRVGRGDRQESRVFLDALAAVGPRAAPELVRLSGRPLHRYDRGRALWLLGERRELAAGGLPEESLARLAEGLSDADPAIRVLMGFSLVGAGTAGSLRGRALEVLAAGLEGADDEARWTAVSALECLGPEARGLAPALARAARTEMSGPRWAQTAATLRALGAVGAASPEVLSVLVRALADTNGFVRQCAAEALERLGPGAQDALPSLELALTSGPADIGLPAAKACLAIAPGHEGALRYLLNALAARGRWQRLAAIEAVGRRAPAAPEVEAALEKCRGDPDAKVRQAASEALAKIRGR